MNEHIEFRAPQPKDDDERESLWFNRLRTIDQTWKLSYAEVGLICRDVQARNLWDKRNDPDTGKPCTSFNRWLRLATAWSYATAYSALRDVEALSDIPTVDLAQIPAGNFHALKQLSTAVRADPDVLRCAKTLKSSDFEEHIREQFPLQHIQRTGILRFTHISEATEANLRDAMAIAEAEGAVTQDDQINAVAMEAKLSWVYAAEVENIAAEVPEQL